MVHEAGCWYQGVVCCVCGEEAALAMFHHHAPDLACFHGRTTHPAPLAVTLPVTREAAFVSPPVAVTFQVMFYNSKSMIFVFFKVWQIQ